MPLILCGRVMTQIRTEIFLGIGQGRWSQRLLEQTFRAPVTIHEAFSYTSANDASDIEQLGITYVSRCLKSVRGPYVLYAESQAAPIVIAALMRAKIPTPDKLILLQPLGYNAAQLGATQSAQLRSLLHRSLMFWKHPNQSLLIKGNRVTATQILKDMTKRPLRSRMFVTFGASQDCVRDTVALAHRLPVHIYACADDTLFPYNEIAHNVKKSSIHMHMLGGTHINRATPRGIAQLQSILEEQS